MDARTTNHSFLAVALVALVGVGCGSSNEPATSNEVAPNSQMQNGEPGEADMFENMRAEEIDTTRAVVRFETAVPTSCEAEFGVEEGNLDRAATDPDMAPGELSITHEVPLEDLPPSTTIYWRARAVDEAGEVYLSDLQQFTTAAVEGEQPTLQNFAMNAEILEVSSNFGGAENDATWGVANAFDGKMSTEWSTNGDGDDAMVRVDLGSERKITHFAFRSRMMTDGSSIIEKVQLRFDGGEPVGPFDTPDPDERYLFELEMPRAAQVVTLEAVETTGGNTGAKEIEFLGTPKE